MVNGDRRVAEDDPRTWQPQNRDLDSTDRYPLNLVEQVVFGKPLLFPCSMPMDGETVGRRDRSDWNKGTARLPSEKN